MTSSVDIVIPCYNYGRYLHNCVQSILQQRGVEVRILIIDDASTDDSPEIGRDLARTHPQVSFVRHERNCGHIATYNEGIEWASGQYFLLISADDYLLPGALLASTEFMDDHPEVGFTFGKYLELYDDGTTLEFDPMAAHRSAPGSQAMTAATFIGYSGAHNIVATPTAVIRTDLQKAVGGYRPELPHSGDMEMWLRLASHASVGFIDDYQAVYRRHARNMSIAFLAKQFLPDLVQRKAAFDFFLTEDAARLGEPGRLRRRLYKALARTVVGRASTAFNEGDFETSDKLCAFALSFRPEVRRSLPWLKLSIKRAVGPRTWRSLSALRTGAR